MMAYMPDLITEHQYKCNINIEGFEGPLDLLLYLVRKEEIDIFDLPVAKITKQYIEYLDFMRQLNIEIAGEYLYIASILISIKARMLLPSPTIPKETEELREELISALAEYRQIKNAGEYLRVRLNDESKYYRKGYTVLPASMRNGIEVSLDIVELFRTGWELLKRENKVFDSPHQEKLCVSERMEFIENLVALRKRISLFEIFDRKPITKFFFIGTFFAALELLRLKKIILRQNSPFGNIWIYRRNGEIEVLANKVGHEISNNIAIREN